MIIDGLRCSEGFDDTTYKYIPKIGNILKPKGTIYTNFYCMGYTATTSGHATITSGISQFMPNTMTYNYGDLERVQEDPSIFQYYRAQLGIPKDQVWLINGKGRMISKTGFSLHPYYGDSFEPHVAFTLARNDNDTWTHTQNIIDTYKPSLVLINLKDTDDQGHKGTWNSYLNAITNADTIVHDLFFKVTQDDHYKDKTAFIITSDHGRHVDSVLTGFKDHGCTCIGCRRVPFLVIGPGIRENTVVAERGFLRDIAPTVGSMLGFEASYSNGRVLTEIFNSPPSATPTRLEEPSVASDGTNFHMAATRYEGDASRIFYSRSTNSGQTWSGYVTLSIGANNIEPSIAAEGNNVAVAWCTYMADSSCAVAFSESVDGGATWGSYQTFGGSDPLQPDICPSVEYSQGVVTLMWSEQRAVHRVRLQNGSVISSDQFDTVTPSRISISNLQSDTHVVYNRMLPTIKNKEIYYCQDSGSGWFTPTRISWSSGDSLHPDIATDTNGIHVVWTQNYNGKLRIVSRNSPDGNTWSRTRLIDHSTLGARNPCIAAASNKVVVVWENFDTENSSLFGSTSSDGGITWTTPLRIAETSGYDATPAMAVDQLDLMYLIWAVYSYPSYLSDKTLQL